MLNRILVVEDEKSLLDAIRMNLEMEDYEVVIATNGLEALKIFKEQRFNLIVLDVMMPEMDGFQVCEKIRISDSETPILFLTAKDTHEDKVMGLKLGADDYLTKPFNLEELLLRVKILVKHSLKRTGKDKKSATVEFGNCMVDFKTFTAKGTSGKKIQLTQKEAALLKLLIDRKNQVVSRQHILQTAWGYDVTPSTRTIDNFILAFRRYFEKDSRNPKHFFSIRGVGYKFVE